MRVAALERETVLFVARNMREWDRKEISATRWDDSPEALTEDCLRIGACGWVLGLERPIVAGGCWERWPGVFSMWMFATDEVRQIGLSMTKFVKRTIIPIVMEGAHRLDAHSMVGHEDAQAWLTTIGARREFPEPTRGYGKNGEDFYSYVW